MYDDSFVESRPDYGDPLNRGEIEKLLKAGVSDGVIVEKAKKAGSQKLDADDIVALKQAGATDDLVKSLIASERQQPDRAVVVVPTTRYVYTDYWWGPPSFYYSYYRGWGYPYYYRYGHYGHGHGYGYYGYSSGRGSGGRAGGGVRVGW